MSEAPRVIAPITAGDMKIAYMSIKTLADDMASNDVKWPCLNHGRGEKCCLLRYDQAKRNDSPDINVTVDLCPVCQLLDHAMQAETAAMQQTRVQQMVDAGR